MKTLFKKSIVLLLIFTIFSCSKDSATSSSNCTPIPCLNGGVSRPDCGCNCPQGFTGANCSTQITPTKINISKIEIFNYSVVDPYAVTGYWDYAPISNPDLAIVITDTYTSTILTDTSNVPYIDALPNTTYTYTYQSFPITNVNDLFKIELRDIDPNNTYESMSAKYFTIYDSHNSFPSVISIVDGDTTYKIYVSYTW